MSDARRAELVKAAAELNLPLVEDNPYGDLWFDNPPPAPLTARNPEGCIYMGSFSRCWPLQPAPGLHVAPKRPCTPSCCKPNGRSTCTPRLQPAPGGRSDEGRLPGPPCAHHPRAVQTTCEAMLAALDKEMQTSGRAHWNRPRWRHVPWSAPAGSMSAIELLPKPWSAMWPLCPGRLLCRQRRPAHAAPVVRDVDGRADRHRRRRAGCNHP